MNLYDYIYVDLDKVISLYSQLTGGIIELRETNQEKLSQSSRKRDLDFRVIKYESGTSSEQTGIHKETIKPHHAVLKELEQALFDNDHIIDLSKQSPRVQLKDSYLRTQIKDSLCLKCRGRIVIEDYERIKEIAKDYPDIVKLINKSYEENLKETDEYKKAMSEIDQLESIGTDRNKKAKGKQAAKAMRKRIENELKEAVMLKGVPQWILDGMQTWIDTFLPGIVNIRLYPNLNERDEHVLGHLNVDGFTIKDKASFHFTYGSFPTEEFTLLGIVTSVPQKSPDTFDPLAEFQKDVLEDVEAVESAFRGVFRGFDGIEAMIRTIRYPRILVQPLLVYREATPNKSIEQSD